MLQSLNRGGVMGTVARCLVGLVVIALAIAVEKALWSSVPLSPFLLVYPAVIFATWIGGWPAGITVILMASLALPYWFLPPLDSFAIVARRDAIDLGIFVVMSLAFVWLVVRVRSTLMEARTARGIAERATAAKDTVLAVVAHDLRNPLQTIGLSAELLSTELAAANANSDDGRHDESAPDPASCRARLPPRRQHPRQRPYRVDAFSGRPIGRVTLVAPRRELGAVQAACRRAPHRFRLAAARHSGGRLAGLRPRPDCSGALQSCRQCASVHACRRQGRGRCTACRRGFASRLPTQARA